MTCAGELRVWTGGWSACLPGGDEWGKGLGAFAEGGGGAGPWATRLRPPLTPPSPPASSGSTLHNLGPKPKPLGCTGLGPGLLGAWAAVPRPLLALPQPRNSCPKFSLGTLGAWLAFTPAGGSWPSRLRSFPTPQDGSEPPCPEPPWSLSACALCAAPRGAELFESWALTGSAVATAVVCVDQ